MTPPNLKSFQVCVLVLMLVIPFLGACDRHATQSDVPAGVKPAVATKEVVTETDKVEAPTVEGVGKSCLVDRSCSGYLRCMEAKCAVPPAVTGESEETSPTVVFRRGREADSEELGRFFVELAISPEEQQRGLMYRRHMEPDWGMIFIYPRDSILSFWMKNTLISLDMIFVPSSGEVVGVVEGAQPLTLEPRTVNKPSRYVVELNAGKAREYGIEAGTWMSTNYVDEAHSPAH
ncbi:MAG: DUF192 domain-containing protein [Bradymonadaceae bacterium]